MRRGSDPVKVDLRMRMGPPFRLSVLLLVLKGSGNPRLDDLQPEKTW